MSELIGQEVAGFRIVRELARGGMGIVFEAEQVRLGRTVALKMLHPALTVDRDFLRRFEREAKTLGRLNHENIVNVIDFLHHGDRYFLALEFVEGETLARRLRRCTRQRRFLSLGEAATIAWQVAQALAYAHDRKIVHRDLKPDNIMLTPRGRAKVMDFGIAQIVGGASTDTEVGTRVGTPDYMAPEQLRGQSTDCRSDLFSLGLIFYEMMAGHRPFSQADLLRAAAEQPIAVPWDEGAMPPGGVRARPILDRLLAVDPRQRYGSASELLDDMRERLGGDVLGDEAWATPPRQAVTEPEQEPAPAHAPPDRRHWLRWVLAALVILTLALGAIVNQRRQEAQFEEQQHKIEATRAHFDAFIADSQGRVTEAEHLFIRATDLDPTVARYWRDLGDFYFKQGKPEDAVYSYRKTLELDSSDVETRQRLQEIKSTTKSEDSPTTK